MKNETYTVIYRTGGLENYKWNRVLELYNDYQDAITCRKAVFVVVILNKLKL